ncbi:hypothetical protein JXO52_10700 [bacterium]|nr:hypothetical protein [bacterium]
MRLPPTFIVVKVTPPRQKTIHVWLPVVLLWPLVLLLLTLPFFLILLADLLTLFRFRLTRLMVAVLALTLELRGTCVTVSPAGSARKTTLIII